MCYYDLIDSSFLDYYDLPVISEYYDVLGIEHKPLLDRISAVWTDEMSDKFYEEWEADNCMGAILDDYFYILGMFLGREKAVEIYREDL